MTDFKSREEFIRRVWHTYLTTGEILDEADPPWYERKWFRPLVKRLPKSPRCNICYIPFAGIGGRMAKIFWDVEPSRLNPHICNNCERFAQEYSGGVELEISMLFVDVRGSVPLAEKTSLSEYSKLINRFYRAATEEFYRSYGFVEKLIGDQVAGFFVPGFAGKDHARVAVETGKRIMRKMGYGGSSQPWIQAGMGINTGLAYVGSVDTEGGAKDISMLGDAVNITARLTSHAASGEILISDSARLAAGLKNDLEARQLKLKGKSGQITAWAMKIGGEK